MPLTGLKERIVVVTGGNRGIGAATAKAFAAEGAAVFITCWGTEAPDPVIAAIREQGGKFAAWEADLADPGNIPTLFDQVESAFGPMEVLINNAAGWQADSFVPSSGNIWPPSSDPISPLSFNANFAVNAQA